MSTVLAILSGGSLDHAENGTTTEVCLSYSSFFDCPVHNAEDNISAINDDDSIELLVDEIASLTTSPSDESFTSDSSSERKRSDGQDGLEDCPPDQQDRDMARDKSEDPS